MQERVVTITFPITSRDFSARGLALERSLILAAERATEAFRAPGFGVGPYSANAVGVSTIVHAHEGHPLEGAYHEHVYSDGPHEHPNLGLGAIRRDN